jgi:hypothetical protein
VLHILKVEGGLLSQWPSALSPKEGNGPRHAVFSGASPDGTVKLHVVNERGNVGQVDTTSASF